MNTTQSNKDKEVYVCSDCKKTYDDINFALSCCIHEEEDCFLSHLEIIKVPKDKF